jgi:cytochrome c oxidase cbb3-type subunit 3
MRNRMYLILAASVLAAVGCGNQPHTVAAAGASPGVAMDIPVGPIPGVATQPALPTNPYAGNTVAMLEGRRLFVQYNCSGCHGGHAGGGMGPSLRDPSWRYGGDDAHIFATISEGRGQGMPAWGGKIPREQIWQLVAYIKSLRTPQEPEPPR